MAGTLLPTSHNVEKNSTAQFIKIDGFCVLVSSAMGRGGGELVFMDLASYYHISICLFLSSTKNTNATNENISLSGNACNSRLQIKHLNVE